MRNIWWVTLGVAGCVTTVEKTPTDDTDGTTAGDDDDDTTPDPPGPDGSVAGCAGEYTGTYGGLEQGNFEATLDPILMTLVVVDVDESGQLDGIADVEADGTLYGESQGVWIEGSIDLDTCAMGGDWGLTSVPGVPGGTWQTD